MNQSKLRISALLGLSAMLSVTLSACGGGKTTVNLNDYFTTEISGAEGSGAASATFATADMVSANYEAFGLTQDDSLAKFNQVCESINACLINEVTPSSNLSNGDTVVFSWQQDGIERLEDTYDIKVEFEEVKVTVADLQPVKEVDMFDYVTVAFVPYEDRDGVYEITITLNDDCPFPDMLKTGATRLVENLTQPDAFVRKTLGEEGDVMRVRLPANYTEDYALAHGISIKNAPTSISDGDGYFGFVKEFTVTAP